jgi:hypothetical protein
LPPEADDLLVPPPQSGDEPTAEDPFATARWRQACDAYLADEYWNGPEKTAPTDVAALATLLGAMAWDWPTSPAANASAARRRLRLGKPAPE